MSRADDFGALLRSKFEQAKADRTIYEQMWLRDLRQYRGEYDPDILSRIPQGRSQAYIRLTRTKVKTMDSRLMDMFFPAGGDKNWGLKLEESPSGYEETANPDDQGSMYQPTAPQPGMLGRLGQRIMGQGVQTSSDEDAERKAAEEKMDAMECEIERQLRDCHYQRECRRVIHSGNLYGTGILKGPLVESHKLGSWQINSEGVHVYAEADEVRPYLEFVPIWDVYPDLAARELSDCEFIFQRHVMLRHDLRRLASRGDFDGKRIMRYISEHQEGDAGPATFDAEIRALGGNATQPAGSGPRFEVVEYWGYVDGRDLASCGCKIEEDREFEANIWMLGNQVIKAALNPFDADIRPYHFYYFERDEASIFGVGIANIVRDSDRVFNASIRAAIDNAAISAGPIIEINQSLLAPGEDARGIYSFREFVRTGTGTEANAPAIRSYTVANNTPQLLNMAGVFKQLSDEASAIPAYVHGENSQGVARTVGGLSMLMGAANITLKDTAGHYDEGVTKPVISALYHWNMQFSEKRDIQGSYRIVTEGAESLVAKEIRAQQIERMAAQVANPLDAPYIDRKALNRERIRANELNEENLMKSDEEIKKELAAQAAQPNPDAMKLRLEREKLQSKEEIEAAKIRLEAAKLDLERRQTIIEHQEQMLEDELESRKARLDRAEEYREAELRWGQ